MIKFSINSMEFLEAVDKVAQAVTVTKEGGGVVESMVQIRVFRDVPFKENRLGAMLAFDSSKQLISSFEVGDVQAEESDCEFYLSGKKLRDLANAFADEEVLLNVTVEAEFKIEDGNSEVKLPLGEKGTFIEAEEGVLQELEIQAKELQRLLRYGASAYDPGGRKDLRNICLNFNKGEKKAVAISSDTSRIAYAEAGDLAFTEKTTTEEKMVLLDGGQIKALGKILGDGTAVVHISERQFYVKCGTDVAIFLMKEGSYPLKEIVKLKDSMKESATLKISNRDMLKALAIYEIGLVGEDPYMEVASVNEKQVCFGSAGSKTRTKVSVLQKGSFEKIGLSGKALKQALSGYQRDKDLVIEIEGAARPIHIKEEGSKNVIMLSSIYRGKKKEEAK